MIGRADRDARFATWLNEFTDNGQRTITDKEAFDSRYRFSVIEATAYSGSDDGGCRAELRLDGWKPQLTPAQEAVWCLERAAELRMEANHLASRARNLTT